jgi:C1A family cysteine protease
MYVFYVLLGTLFLPCFSFFYPFNINNHHLKKIPVLSMIFNKKNNIEDNYIEYLKEYNQLKTPSNNQFLNGFYSQFSKKQFYEEDKYKIFEKNFLFIQSENKKLKDNKESFELGFNEFFDKVPFDNTSANVMNKPIQYNQSIYNKFEKYFQNPLFYLDKLFNNNKTVNWNDTECISPVKNQGSCGSCWAFATTSALEVFMRYHNYSVYRLSEQQLVDCSSENFGCNGGYMDKAFDYIITNDGLLSDENYPYVAKTMNCRSYTCNQCNADHTYIDSNDTIKIHTQNVNGSGIKEYDYIISKSIFDICLSLQTSPITIAIDASSYYFQFYKSGVIDVPNSPNMKLNHAVLLVGYGNDEKGLYWIIQNSWGTSWGDHGFCKIRVKEGEGVLLSNLFGVYPSKYKK